jgi:hypothetical protein
MPMIHRFVLFNGVPEVLHVPFILDIFLCSHLNVLIHLPCHQALIICLWFEPHTGQAFDWAFIWLIDLFISRSSILFFSQFRYLYRIALSCSELSSLFHWTLWVLLDFTHVLFNFIYHSYNHFSNSLSEIFFPHFLGFYVGIYSSEVKTLVGSFNHL